MDALVAAAVEAADGAEPRIVILPVAAARQRPELAAAHGEGAFRAAAARAGTRADVTSAMIRTRQDAARADACALLEAAHLVHLPGGDPDLAPAVLRDTPAWAAVLRARGRGACLAGASAGAMALAGRLWTRGGAMDGLGLLPGLAVLPHFAADRLAAWRTTLEADEAALTWLGLDEQTMVIGRPGGAWAVAGPGRAHLIPPGATTPVTSAAHGGRLAIG